MPIAILKIPRGQSLKLEGKTAKDFCDEVGGILHKKIKVPDENDRESLVEDTESGSLSLEFNFTIGPNEYPDKKDPRFFPTLRTIRKAGRLIRHRIKALGIEIPEITIKAWRDTTFLLRGDEDDIEVTQETIGLAQKMASEIREARIRLVLSPDKYQGGGSGVEVEGGGQRNEFDSTVEDISVRLREILGLPEGAVGLEIVRATAADTDTSVEYDCETKSGKPIPEGVRKFMAKTVMEVLNGDGKIGERSAEVWIRQGKAEIGERF